MASGASAQDTGTVRGRIIDGANLVPVSDVVVQIRALELSSLTDQLGRFVIEDVPAGRYALNVVHLAFEERADSIVVRPARETAIEIHLEAKILEIDSLLVEAPTALQQRRRSTGAVMSEINRPVIDLAARQGMNLGELIGNQLPAVRVQDTNMGFLSCVEFRGGTGMTGGCKMMAIFIDGVYMSGPGTIPPNIPLNDIERIEAISPGQAGVQYGSLGGYGVLLIETRTGPRVTPPPAATANAVIGFDWSEEAEPYPYWKVLGLSALGNAIGLGVGLVAAHQCLGVDDGTLGVRASCNALKSITVGSLAVGLPTFIGSLGARRGGLTDRSQGRVLPTAILGSLSALTGYLFLLEGQDVGATVMLGIGAPVLMTFADRAFRVLR